MHQLESIGLSFAFKGEWEGGKIPTFPYPTWPQEGAPNGWLYLERNSSPGHGNGQRKLDLKGVF